MASEITVTSSLGILKGNLQYQSKPTSFKADMGGTSGPTPGAFTVTTTGTACDLSKIQVYGGLCRIQNLDATNFVEYGLKDVSGGGSGSFYPLGELLPGETYTLRLSRNILAEYNITGTGTSPRNFDQFFFKANGASCQVLVEAFDK